MTIRLVDNTDSSPSENFFPITSSEDFRLIHLLTAATDAAKAAARNVVCNMTIAFPVLSTLTPSPWSCAAALNVVGSWCNFTGIDCKPSVSPNPQLYILNIDLSGRHLVGRIPSALGQLSSLQSLALSSNQISGTIPSSLASLSTSLTGSIVRLLFSSMKNQPYSHLPVPLPTSTPIPTFTSIVCKSEFFDWHCAQFIDPIDQIAIFKCELQLFDGHIAQLFLHQYLQQCISERVFHIRRTQVSFH